MWPNETVKKNLMVGMSVVTPTVGWAQTDNSGAFTLDVDTTKLGAGYYSADGQVNFQAIGWSGNSPV